MRVRVIIDGRFVLDVADLHRRMVASFGYGPLYRHDLASLHDRLAAGEPRPLTLIWTHAGAIRLALGRPGYDKYVAVLESIQAQDAGKPWYERFVFQIFEE
jgi:RNAse (barnase) inhibitor barstar